MLFIKLNKFWYDYVKPKYQDVAKLCYMDTNSFIIHIKTKDFCKDIANDVGKCFDIYNYDEDVCNSIEKRPVTMGKNKKVIVFF